MRNSILDAAKGIGIWLVLLGHAAAWGNPAIFKFIYSFHMPLFFLLAGFFYKDRPVAETARINFNRLIIPYAIIGFSCAIPSIVFGNTASIDQFLKQFAGTIYSVPRSDWTFYCTPIWFLTCLFCTEVIYSAITKFKLFPIHLTALSIFGVAVIAFNFGPILSPWNSLNACIAILFYHLGVVIKKAGWFSPDSSRAKHLILSVPTIAIYFLGVKYNPSFVNLAAGGIGDLLPFLASSIAGSLLALQLSSLARGVSALAFFGRNTIILFGYNYWILRLGNYIALDTYGWAISFLIQIPLYILLATVSEQSPLVSSLLKRSSKKSGEDARKTVQ